LHLKCEPKALSKSLKCPFKAVISAIPLLLPKVGPKLIPLQVQSYATDPRTSPHIRIVDFQAAIAIVVIVMSKNRAGGGAFPETPLRG